MDYLSTGGISGGSQAVSLSSPAGASAKASNKDMSFKDMIGSFFNNVNNLQFQADEKMKAFAAGDIQNIHEVFLAAEKAKLALQLAAQIRTQIVTAYNTIMSMQV